MLIPTTPEPTRRELDMAMMIRMLCSHTANAKTRERAMEMLRKYGLQGSPLRDEAAALRESGSVTLTETDRSDLRVAANIIDRDGPSPIGVELSATLRRIASAGVPGTQGAEAGRAAAQRLLADPGMRSIMENLKDGDGVALDGEAQRKADERMRHDYPILQQFHSKHALGAKAAPSCLCCGQQTHPITRPIAVQHMELPAIVICKQCKDASGVDVPGEGKR